MSNQTIKTLIIMLFVSLLALPMIAQKATLKGKLTNEDDGTTLPFATININDGETGATTDFDGNYEIQLDAGTYNVTYEYIGLTAKTQQITLAAGETKDMSVGLTESAELLEQVVVTGTKSGVKIGESTVSIAVVKPDLLNNTNSDSDEIVQKVPGVSVIDGQANIRGGSGYSYGAGSRVLLLVDDLPFLAGDAGFPNWSDIPIENAGQVEVLKGAASSLYGSSAMNGIINFKTAYPTSESYTRVSLYNVNYFPPRTESIINDEGTEVDLDRQWWDNDDSRRDVLFEGDSTTLNKPGDRGVQFAHRQKFGKFDLVVGGVLYDNYGFRQFSRDRKARLNFNTRYRITDKFSVGVNGNINRGSSVSYFLWQDPDNGAFESFQRLTEPLYSLATLVNFNPEFNTTTPSQTFRYNIDPFLTIFDEKGNRHKILSRYYHIENDNGNNQSNFSDLLYGEYQFQREFKESGINLVAGALGQVTYSEAQLYGNSKYSSSNIGAYAQIDKRFADKLTLSLGGRYEMNTINSPEIINSSESCHEGGRIDNPEPTSREAKPVFRAGLNYQPAEYTYLRASWGQGYRFPTIAERYVSTSVGDLLFICPNPSLQSETGWSAEIGARQGVKISSWQGFVDLSYFWTEYQDMMEFTFGGPDADGTVNGFQSGNIDDTRIRGAEISFLGQGELFGVPTNLIAGYTYIDPQYQNFDAQTAANSTSNENILKYRFRHTAKLDIESTFKKKLSIGASLQYNSKMEALDIYFYDLGKFLLADFEDLINTIQPNGQGFDELAGDILGIKAFRDRKDGGTAVLDFRVAYNISEVAKISFILKNATNQVYTLRPALMEAPMNLTVRADVTLRGKAKN